MPSHNIDRSWSSGNESDAGREIITADAELRIDLPVAHSTTDLSASVPIDVSAVKSLYIKSDKDVQIETNGSGGSADDTLQLKANVPLIWTPNSGFACPLTVDVVTMLVTNSGSTADDDATVRIRVLIDPTP